MHKGVWLLVSVLVVVAAAGTAYALTRDGDVEGGEKSDSDAATSLTITYLADENDAEKTYELTCGPTGGDHPNATQACRALGDIDVDVSQPVPAGKACTMIYGGPETATVRGILNGEKVDATFSRENGCEIARWEAAKALFPDFES